jgi:hypothetical protein
MLKALVLFTTGVIAAVPESCFTTVGPYGGSAGLTTFTNAG